MWIADSHENVVNRLSYLRRVSKILTGSAFLEDSTFQRSEMLLSSQFRSGTIFTWLQKRNNSSSWSLERIPDETKQSCALGMLCGLYFVSFEAVFWQRSCLGVV